MLPVEQTCCQKQVPENGEAERTRNRDVYVPHVDIRESETAITLFVDMPGAAEEGVDVTIEKNTLTIRGSVPKQDFSGYSQVQTEYGLGDYERTFIVSNEIDRERVEAVLKNGVLKVVLPKAKHALSHKVSVRSAE